MGFIVKKFKLYRTIKKNQDKIYWYQFSANPNAVEILKANPDKIDWYYLSSNPNAIELLEANQDKIDWIWLSLNEGAIELLKANPDKIVYKWFPENPSIFELDYKQMRINFQDLEEEIIKEVMKPRRIFRNLELYGYDVDDMFD